MAGRAFANWWTKMRPYYAGAYQEMWVGLGIMTLLYYKISYGDHDTGLDILLKLPVNQMMHV
uniref:Uncharacterized protein n=1 Tax=Esox lucius TaxID=8010 RepID=A0AAY5K3G5_ESOLU